MCRAGVSFSGSASLLPVHWVPPIPSGFQQGKCYSGPAARGAAPGPQCEFPPITWSSAATTSVLRLWTWSPFPW